MTRTFASDYNIFACHGKLPPVVQSKRRHPQDRSHVHNYQGGGLENCPQGLIRECEIAVEKGQ
jgi:hypothetical protein